MITWENCVAAKQDPGSKKEGPTLMSFNLSSLIKESILYVILITQFLITQ